MRSTFLIVLSLIQCSCTEQQIETKPQSDAYSDGFEVVVKNTDSLFTSHHLKEAELLVTSGATFKLDLSDVDKIEKDLDTKKQNVSGRKYPFARVNIEPDSNGGQSIELSYHFSKSTYFYKYKVINGKLTPISSGYKDLTRNSLVHYE